MPTYQFHNKSTNETWEEFCTFAEREEILKNPDVEQLPCAPALSSGRGMQKPDANFRDLLKHIDKRAGKRSTINTY